MYKKLSAGLLPLLALAAFAVAPSVAAAAPHWFSDGVKLPENGEKVAVTTSSRSAKLKLKDNELGKEVEGTVTDEGFIWNPAGGGAGEDEITSFVTAKNVGNICAAKEVTEVVATNLPWKTVLLTGPPIRDEVKGVEVDILCNGTPVAVYEGTLTPKFVNSAVAKCKGANDSFAEFEEAASGGFLTSNFGTKGKISGLDYLQGPAKDTCITAE